MKKHKKAIEISGKCPNCPPFPQILDKTCRGCCSRGFYASAMQMYEWTKSEVVQWLLNNACNYMFCADDTIDEYYFDDKQMVSDLIKFLEQ